MGVGGDDFDAIGFNRAVHERLDSLIEVRDEAQD
jgi:hypothetical protein